jgi:hypothetical protein
MDTSVMVRISRLDAPFWGVLVVGLFCAGALGCLGVGLVAARTSPMTAEVMTTDHCPPPRDLP